MKSNQSLAQSKKHLSRIFSGTMIEKSKSNLVIPKHRKSKRFNTIEEYIEFVKDKKWTFLEFKNNGYCGAQISCFNFIIKGGLTITKDQFIDEYCNKLIPLREIEKKYKIPYGCITFIREYFGVKRIGANGIKRGKEEIPLNEIQKQVIYGSLMGDCCRFENGLSFKQSAFHKDYLAHLFEIFKEHCACDFVSETVSYDDRYDSKSIAVSFYTRNHRQIKSICNEFYVENRKTVSREILNKLTTMSVAYWFMDDGYSALNKNGASREFCSLGVSKIYTCSFTYEENVLIKNWLKEKFDIECLIKFKSKDSTNPYLLFYVEDANKLRNLARPYIVDSMLYKVDYEKAKERYHRDNSTFDLSKLPSGERYVNFDEENKKKVVDTIFEYYRKTGFPYIVLDEESMNISFERILNWQKRHLYHEDGKTIKNNTNSTNLVWHFQRHMFDIGSRGSLTPIQIFNNDDLFRTTIERCLEYVGACSHANIRAILKESKGNRCVNSMSPAVAKAVYMYFDRPLSVLDFSAGFGGRLLGAMTSENVKRYVGIDSLKETCDGLNAIYEKFKNLSYPSVSIINGQPEFALDSINESFDLVFASPPFFDKEIYSKNQEQSCVKYSDYKDWLKNWLMVVVDKSTLKLNKKGKLVIWIGHSDDHNIAEDFLIESRNILSLDDVLYFEMPKNAYNRKKGDSYRLEKFLIMSRK